MSKFFNAAAIKRALRSALQHLRPPPNLKPSEWAEKHVRIPVGNAIPGPIRFDNAPHQREPLDMVIDPECYRITLMWGAQIGKTMLALIAQGYHIAVRPASQMMMQPSETDLQVWMNTKFSPMIDSTPDIRERLAKPRGRAGVNNSRMKSYPGGFIMFAWSGSPRTMRGRSAPLIVCDEVDGYQATDEGHPVGLLWQRAATFPDRLLLEISTPTVDGESYIADAYEAGDQRERWVPCPDCHELQVLRWENLTWDGRQSTGVDDAQKDAGHDHDPTTARYTCAHCGSLWTDGQRIWALRNAEKMGGGWRGRKPFRGHASYHAWEIHSTMRTHRDIVQSYLDKLAQDDLQTFVNVSLSRTYALQGESTDADGLMARAEDYAAPVPAGGLVLTAGVDMQPDRLEVEVVAWGHGEESWSVEHYVLWGDPDAGDVWEELETLLGSTWLHESGAHLPISAACVDTGGTGGNTQSAYDWLRGKTGRRIFGTKGVAGWGRPIVASPLRRQSGRKARKVDLFLVGADEAKLVVMRRLAVAQPGPGYCHFPKTRHAEWFAQLGAEKLVTRYVKGYPVREWHKTRPRNEALDCRVLAHAALKIVNPSMNRAASRLGVRIEPPSGYTPPAAPANGPPPPKPSRPLPQPADEPEIPPEESKPSLLETAKRKKPPPPRRRGGFIRNY